MGEMTTRQKRAWWSVRGIALQVVAVGAGFAVWKLGEDGQREFPRLAGLLTAVAAQVFTTPFVPKREAPARRRRWLPPRRSAILFSLLGAALPVVAFLLLRTPRIIFFRPLEVFFFTWWDPVLLLWPAVLALLFGFVGFRMGCTFGWEGWERPQARPPS